MALKKNSTFIATSIDGYIADKNGGIEWLNAVPNPEHKDLGYLHFMEKIDALLMGRLTFEKVLSFGIDWPFDKPVFVWSSQMKSVPKDLEGKVQLVSGTAATVLSEIELRGYSQLYIDGGATIRSFLAEDRIDQLIISRIPVLLGGGISLFGELPGMLSFSLVKTEVFLNQIVQDTYIRIRD
ncbi:dihydrofolate reductase family protein [Maribellus mangrovi]|uniref:dihydrofolate reductase family protein n=1 Tax=Maribellus mangrovi TaxID=3133146 RepID=UPI0030ECD694